MISSSSDLLLTFSSLWKSGVRDVDFCDQELPLWRGACHMRLECGRGRDEESSPMGFADWERLSHVPSFGRLLMSAPLEPGDLPDRNRAPMRDAGL
jgi:hypothetical protein